MGKKIEKSSAKSVSGKTVKKAAAPKKTAPAKKSNVKSVSPKKTAKPAVKKVAAKPAPKAVKVAARKAVAKPVVKAIAKPAPKAAAKKVAAKPVAKAAAAKPAPKAIAKPAAKKVPAKPAPKAVAKPAEKPVVKKATRGRKEGTLKKLRLSKADKKYFYDLLIHARSAFGAQVRYHSDDALTRKDAAGERAGMATHMADLGTDNYRRDFELGLLSDGVDVLEMIDEALQRLEDSEYGICLDCGTPIPRKRLEAKPYAKYCTACKSKREAMDETFYHRR
ncbi:MAG: TraR/DksA C4-type zinc finger protein [Lentisphaeria bacterium]|nr:TraR/DksA C4-type zinc finger protein [Lentisphaeria bacterium]